jgi:hypothetical protein
MKIRSGFVSNSSSSSFIVAFDYKPNEYSLDEMLFGSLACSPTKWEERFYPPGCNAKLKKDEKPNGFPFSTVAKVVWDGLKYQKPMTRKQIVDEIDHGYIPLPEDEEENPYDFEKDRSKWEKYHVILDRKRRKIAEEIAEKFLASLPPNSQVFLFEYGDEDGELFSAMEHEGLFRRFQHIHISKH